MRQHPSALLTKADIDKDEGQMQRSSYAAKTTDDFDYANYHVLDEVNTKAPKMYNSCLFCFCTKHQSHVISHAH